MNAKKLIVIILAEVLLAANSPLQASLMGIFTGDVAPNNWTISNYGTGAGSYSFTPDASLLSISGSANSVDYDVVMSAAITTASGINIGWALNSNGNTGNAPLAYCDVTVGGRVYENYNLVGSSGVINGINLPAGSTLQFELASESGTTDGKLPAMLDVTVVPEPGGWLAGLFVLVVVGWPLVRAKLHSSERSSS